MVFLSLSLALPRDNKQLGNSGISCRHQPDGKLFLVRFPDLPETVALGGGRGSSPQLRGERVVNCLGSLPE
jgi:hypothetical protein